MKKPTLKAPHLESLYEKKTENKFDTNGKCAESIHNSYNKSSFLIWFDFLDKVDVY